MSSAGDTLSQRRCPYCGELVTSDAITCPRCYRKIERSDIDESRTDAFEKENRHVNRNKIALLLALIPGLFGFIGIGRIYQDRRNRSGWMCLIAGLLLFISANMIIFGTFGLMAAFAIPFIILYVLLFLYALVSTAIDGFLMPFGLKIQ